MSPKRRVRPEDLSPSDKDHSPSARKITRQYGTPNTPDPPDVVALEEAMVPPLTMSGYLALATALMALLPRLRSMRFISEMMGLTIFAFPFILGGYSTGILGDASNSFTHGVVSPDGEFIMPSNGTMTLLLAGTLIGIIIWLILKSMLDSRAYSLLRRTLSGKDSSFRPGHHKAPAFFAANLLQFALATGAGMATAPVIMRLGAKGLILHDSTLLYTLVIPITTGMLLYVGIRILCMYLSGWMTWRPTFIAGAVGAALAAPVRGARIFWGSYLFLLPLVSAGTLIIILCAAGMWAPTVHIDVPDILLHLCLIGTSILVIQSLIWFDISIVASIGHRVGEFSVAQSPEEAARLRTAALKANLGSSEQQTIAAAPAGIFRAHEDTPYTPTSFSEIIERIQQIRPAVAPVEPSLAESPFTDSPTAEPTYADATLDAPSTVHSTPATDASLAEVAAEDEHGKAPNPWFAPAIEDDGTGARGLERLQPEILPLTMRNANDQPERRYIASR